MSVIGSLTTRLRGARGALDDAVLIRARAAAAAATRTASSACQTLGATLAEQRAMLDSAADKGRLTVARSQDVRVTIRRTRDALERAKLLALNTGLDGAHQGEGRGRALVLLAEELMEVVRTGTSSLDELEKLFDELDSDHHALGHDVEAARNKSADLSQGLLRTQSSMRDSEDALAHLGRVLSETASTDLESARLLAEVAEHARGLVDALSALSQGPRRSLVWRALRPTLGPLLRLLRDLEAKTQRGEDGP
ncbi:MAG: hypothetical protein R3B13_19060 [Polyangiaceae bacterium]